MRCLPDPLEPLDRNGEMHPSLVFGEGVELVHDDELASLQGVAVSLLRKHDGEALRSRNQEMGRLSSLLLAFARRGVASPKPDRDHLLQAKIRERAPEILFDVVGESAERRYIDTSDPMLLERSGIVLAGESVNDPKEAGESFSRTGRGGEKH